MSIVLELIISGLYKNHQLCIRSYHINVLILYVSPTKEWFSFLKADFCAERWKWFCNHNWTGKACKLQTCFVQTHVYLLLQLISQISLSILLQYSTRHSSIRPGISLLALIQGQILVLKRYFKTPLPQELIQDAMLFLKPRAILQRYCM